MPGEDPQEVYPLFKRLKQYIKNPQDEEDRLYNTILEELYVDYYFHMANSLKYFIWRKETDLQ